MYLLTDNINIQGYFGYALRPDKISFNISKIDPFRKNLPELKSTKKTPFSLMAIVGRWIVVYKADPVNGEEKIYFIDYRIEVDNLLMKDIFSSNNLKAIKELQLEFDNKFSPKFDVVELTYAEPFETVVKGNFFSCDNDKEVLEKAKSLGAFPVIENLREGETVKVVMVDEKIILNDKPIRNVYAIIHFGGHGEDQRQENGFAYLKLYDFHNNLELIDDFLKSVQKAGGKFDRAYLMERFDKAKLN